MKCAVSGLLTTSPYKPRGSPSILSATRRAMSLAAGIQCRVRLTPALPRGHLHAEQAALR